jgi:hypothetical protein
MHNLLRTMPPYTRMWVMGAIALMLVVLLELILGLFFGHSREWTAIWVSLLVIGATIGAIFWVVGVIRAVRFARRRSARAR